jgi:hypothetical protein
MKQLRMHPKIKGEMLVCYLLMLEPIFLWDVYENFQMVMTNHFICSNTLMFRSSAIKSKQMTEEYNNNNNEDHSSMAIHNRSKRTLQNKELLRVLEALESQGFRLFDYHEN